nr:unnamed protein product [Callosobruchus chinensis]
MLTPLELKKDNFLLELQNLIGKGLVAIEKVSSNLIEKREGSHRKGRLNQMQTLWALQRLGKLSAWLIIPSQNTGSFSAVVILARKSRNL